MELASELLSWFDICLHQCFPARTRLENKQKPRRAFFRRFNIICLNGLDGRVQHRNATTQHKTEYSEPFQPVPSYWEHLLISRSCGDSCFFFHFWHVSLRRTPPEVEERDECERRTWNKPGQFRVWILQSAQFQDADAMTSHNVLSQIYQELKDSWTAHFHWALLLAHFEVCIASTLCALQYPRLLCVSLLLLNDLHLLATRRLNRRA